MQQALTLPRSVLPLPRLDSAVRLVIAAFVATSLTTGYVVQSRAQVQLSQQVDTARAGALGSRAAAIAAGVPAARLTWEDADLKRLVAQAGPARVAFLDQQWRQWAEAEVVAYHDIGGRYSAEQEAYTQELSGRLGGSLSQLETILGSWTAAGGAPEETGPLHDQGAPLVGQVLSGDIRALDKDVNQVAALLKRAQQGLSAQQQDNANLAQWTQEELASATANLGAEQQKAAQLAYDATGNAEAAARYSVAGSAPLVARIGRHAAAATSSDPATLANAVAWLNVDQGRLGSAMQAGMPAKAIYISTGRQEIRAFDHGKLGQQSLVTTGRPELPTVTGAFHVMTKSSPWTMHSPFSPNSGFWYPDTTVQMVLWFAEGGYGIHDAYWRSTYGPGTNIDGPVPGTHGCVNVPWNQMVWLYNWAEVGTPVTVG